MSHFARNLHGSSCVFYLQISSFKTLIYALKALFVNNETWRRIYLLDILEEAWACKRPQQSKFIYLKTCTTKSPRFTWPRGLCISSICCKRLLLIILVMNSLYHYCTKLAWSTMFFHGDSCTLKIRKASRYWPLWKPIQLHWLMKSGHRLSIPSFTVIPLFHSWFE